MTSQLFHTQGSPETNLFVKAWENNDTIFPTLSDPLVSLKLILQATRLGEKKVSVRDKSQNNDLWNNDYMKGWCLEGKGIGLLEYLCLQP